MVKRTEALRQWCVGKTPHEKQLNLGGVCFCVGPKFLCPNLAADNVYTCEDQVNVGALNELRVLYISKYCLL